MNFCQCKQCALGNVKQSLGTNYFCWTPGWKDSNSRWQMWLYVLPIVCLCAFHLMAPKQSSTQISDIYRSLSMNARWELHAIDKINGSSEDKLTIHRGKSECVCHWIIRMIKTWHYQTASEGLIQIQTFPVTNILKWLRLLKSHPSVQGRLFQICNHFDRAAVPSLLVAEQARAFLGYTNVWTYWSLPSQDQSGQVQGERFSNVNQILFSLSWVSQQSGLVTRVTINV